MLHRLSNRAAMGQEGFTLIEMIVVVGIIAVLSAVILPNVVRHVGAGEQGAQDVELDNVQKAFDLMLAETQVVTIDPHDASTSSNATSSWNALPTGAGAVPLSGYLVNASTVYYYCFDGTGIVLEQFKTAASCTLP